MLNLQTSLILFLLFSVLFNIFLFVPAFIFKTDKLTDISYSLTFIFLSVLLVFNRGLNNLIIWDSVVFLLVVLWSFRLGSYLFVRINKTKKDERFDGIRESFTKFLAFWFIQGISVWVIMIPTILFFNSELPIRSSLLATLGLIIWTLGFVVESISDHQKYRYIQKAKENKTEKHWVDIGLWKYSRHPNYLGEIVLWIGVYLITISRLELVPSIVSLIGPIYIFLILRFFSGVPKLEQKADKRYGDREDYREYKKNTGLILPKI